MIEFKNIVLVLAGSAVGGSARYGIGLYLQAKNNFSFPLGTAIINLLGCFLMGMVYAMATRNPQSSSAIKLLLATGFCGGFTTFSAFAFENLELFKSGQYFTALGYTILSVVLGILAVFTGAYLLK